MFGSGSCSRGKFRPNESMNSRAICLDVNRTFSTSTKENLHPSISPVANHRSPHLYLCDHELILDRSIMKCVFFPGLDNCGRDQTKSYLFLALPALGPVSRRVFFPLCLLLFLIQMRVIIGSGSCLPIWAGLHFCFDFRVRTWSRLLSHEQR